jgi:hypothetical protein
MTGFLFILFVIIALLVTLALVPAIGWLVVIPIAALIWFAVLAGRALAHGHSPSWLLRHTRKAELLGPGGPDDPDR